MLKACTRSSCRARQIYSKPEQYPLGDNDALDVLALTLHTRNSGALVVQGQYKEARSIDIDICYSGCGIRHHQ